MESTGALYMQVTEMKLKSVYSSCSCLEASFRSTQSLSISLLRLQE